MSDTYETTLADVEQDAPPPADEPREAPLAATTTPNPDKPAPVPETAGEPRRFRGYPKKKWHPVHGAREARDPNEEAELFDRNWFDTPEGADAARTEREAQIVLHKNARVRVDEHEERGVVRNSVAAQESLDRGAAEPL
jgi:hypothetical protein